MALGSTENRNAWLSIGACFNQRAGPQGEDFRFYKSGVYNNKKCSPKMKRLDHAVIVSGYAHSYKFLTESSLHVSLYKEHMACCT